MGTQLITLGAFVVLLVKCDNLQNEWAILLLVAALSFLLCYFLLCEINEKSWTLQLHFDMLINKYIFEA